MEENTSKKVFGSKAQEAADRLTSQYENVKTPGQKDPFTKFIDVIAGKMDSIINEMSDNGENNQVKDESNNIIISDALADANVFLSSIDKSIKQSTIALYGVAAALYGNKTIDFNTQLNKFKSLLSSTQTNVGPLSRIINDLETQPDVVDQASPTVEPVIVFDANSLIGQLGQLNKTLAEIKETMIPQQTVSELSGTVSDIKGNLFTTEQLNELFKETATQLFNDMSLHVFTNIGKTGGGQVTVNNNVASPEHQTITFIVKGISRDTAETLSSIIKDIQDADIDAKIADLEKWISETLKLNNSLQALSYKVFEDFHNILELLRQTNLDKFVVEIDEDTIKSFTKLQDLVNIIGDLQINKDTPKNSVIINDLFNALKNIPEEYTFKFNFDKPSLDNVNSILSWVNSLNITTKTVDIVKGLSFLFEKFKNLPEVNSVIFELDADTSLRIMEAVNRLNKIEVDDTILKKINILDSIFMMLSGIPYNKVKFEFSDDNIKDIQQVVNLLNKIKVDKDNLQKIKELNNFITEFNKIPDIKELDVKNFAADFDGILNVYKLLGNFKVKDAQQFSSAINIFNDSINTLSNMNGDNVKQFVDLLLGIGAIPEINEDNVQKIQNTIESLRGINLGFDFGTLDTQVLEKFINYINDVSINDDKINSLYVLIDSLTKLGESTKSGLTSISELFKNLNNLSDRKINIEIDTSNLQRFINYINSINVNTQPLDTFVNYINNVEINNDKLKIISDFINTLGDTKFDFKIDAIDTTELENFIKSFEFKDIENFDNIIGNIEIISKLFNELNILSLQNNSSAISDNSDTIIGSYDTIKDFIDKLNTIVIDDDVFYEVNDISKILESLSELSKFKDIHIPDVNVENITKIIGSFKDVDVTENIKNAKAVSELFKSIVDLGSFRIGKDYDKSIKQLLKLTQKPGLMGTGSSGAIWKLIQNIADAASHAKKTQEGSLQGLGEFILAVTKIGGSLSTRDIEALGNNVSLLNEIIVGEDGIAAVISNINQLAQNNKINKNDIQKLIANTADFINEIYDKLSFRKLFLLEINIMFASSVIGSYGKLLDRIIEVSKKTKEVHRAAQKLTEILDDLNDIDFEKIKNINESLKYFSIINLTLTGVAVTAVPAIVGIYALQLEVKLLDKIIISINNLTELDENASKNAIELGKIVLIFGGLMILAALTGQFVLSHVVQIMAFGIILSAFAWGLSLAFKFISKNMEGDLNKDTILAFGELVAISAAIMIVGGSIFTLFPQLIVGTAIFATVLSLFVLGVTAAYRFGGNLAESIEASDSFSKLVAISGATLLTGGLLFTLVPGLDTNAIFFGFTLAVFVLLVTAAYSGGKVLGQLAGAFLGAKFGGLAGAIAGDTESTEDAIDDAKSFGILVALSAASLLLGAFLFYKYPWMIGSSILFGFILSAFVFAVTAAYSFSSKLGGKGLQRADELNKLIAISALTLLIGGAVMLIPKMPAAVKNFAITLAVFVGLVSLAFGAAAFLGGKAMKSAYALAVLIAVSAGAMLLGGALFMHYPELQENVEKFTEGLLVLIGGMTLIMILLSAFKSQIIWGILGVGAIALITYGFVFILEKLANVSTTADFGKVKEALEIIGIVVGAIVALIAIVGAISVGTGGIGAVAIAAGIATVAALLVFVDKVVDIIIHLGQAAKIVSKYLGDKASAEKFKNTVLDYVKVLGDIVNGFYDSDVTDLKNIIYTIPAMQSAVSAITDMVVGIATGIQKMSSLEINGERMTTQDFVDAANNVALVLTTLGTAVIGVYEENDEMFSWTLIGDNAFTRVAKSGSMLGQMISKIAAGVRDFANLRVDTYDADGKKVGTRAMEHQDFVNAGINISKILTTLGQAVIDTYKGNEEMFSWTLIGDNAFGRVTKSGSMLGQMISKIATGVRDYANLRIDTYDVAGKKVGTRAMTKQDFINAGIHINEILTTLGGAVINTYHNNEKMFTWHLIGDNPYQSVVNSSIKLGEMISKIAQGIRDFASLRIKTYDANGQEVGSRELLKEDFDKAKTNIEDILLAVVSTIQKVYDDHESLFEDDGNIVKTIVEANIKAADLIVKVFECIQKIDKITQEMAWDSSDFGWKMENGVPVEGEFYKLIKNVITMIPEAINDIAKWLNFDEKNSENSIKVINSRLKIFEDAIKAYTSKVENIFTILSKVTNLEVNVDEINTVVQAILSSIVTSSDLIVKNDINTKLDTFTATIGKYNESFGPLVESIVKLNSIKAVDTSIFNKIAISIKDSINTIYEAFKANNPIVNPPLQIFNTVMNGYAGTMSEFIKKFETIKLSLTLDQLDILKKFSDIASSSIVDVADKFGTQETAVQNSIIFDNVITTYINDINKLFGLYGNSADTINAALNTINNLNSLNLNIDDFVADGPKAKLLKAILSLLPDTIKAVSSSWNAPGVKENLDYIGKIFGTYNAKITEFISTINTPIDKSSLDNIVNSFSKINKEIEGIPKLDRFRSEAEILKEYVTHINGLDTTRVDSLTNLANALTTMSTRLGSLEGLTDVLDKKLSVTLKNLTDKLSESAKTFKTAETIQTKRHEKITDAFNKLKQLLDKPMKIEVTHSQEAMDNELSVEGRAGGDAGGGTPQTQRNETPSTGGNWGSPAENYSPQSTPAKQSKQAAPQKEQSSNDENNISPYIRNPQPNPQNMNNASKQVAQKQPDYRPDYITRNDFNVMWDAKWENRMSQDPSRGGGANYGSAAGITDNVFLNS